MKTFIVAIDGTAGSGKSTTALGLAKKLNFFYLDTGAMYRALTLSLLKSGFSLEAEKIKDLIEQTKIDLKKENNAYRVYLNGRDVTKEIRTPAVNERVSQVSALPLVREWMVKKQREIAQRKSVVCEGRDIGTVVFPKADVKIYMRANLLERARRRFKELKKKIVNANLSSIKNNLAFRDDFDSKRKYSPLRVAKGAIVIDTTNLSIKEEIELALLEVKKRIPKHSI